MRQLRLLILFIALAIFSQFYSKAQTKPTQSTNIKATTLEQQANQMAAAFNKGDFAAFAKFTYPKVLQAMGGQAGMIKTLNEQIQEWQEQGISIKSITVGAPSKIVKAGSELHALISQTLVMNVKDGILTKNSYLLAISPNNGVKWFFLDTAPLNNSNVTRMFPNYNKELVIPSKQEPVFTSNQ